MSTVPLEAPVSKSPLGDNTDWVVNADRQYASRELDQATHDMLAVAAVALDPELSQIERSYPERVIVAVRVGKRTLHIRVYNRDEVERRPDEMASRTAYRDTYAYIAFDLNDNKPKLLEGQFREDAQGHRPMLYGDRRLSAERVYELDQIQAKFLKRLPSSSAMALVEALAFTVFNDKPHHPSIETVA